MESESHSPATYTDIRVDQLRTIMAEGDPFLVDVRIPVEGDISETEPNIVLYRRSGK